MSLAKKLTTLFCPVLAAILFAGALSTPTLAATSVKTPAHTAATKTWTFYPAADTYINEAAPNSTYGNADQLWIQNKTGEIKMAFLRFDLGTFSKDYVITKARLVLHQRPVRCHTIAVTQVQGTGNNVQVMGSSSPWGENDLTWNTYPPYQTLNIPRDSRNVDNIDITDMVKWWVSHPASQNWGIRLSGSGSAPCIFESSENTPDKRPTLVVEGRFQPTLTKPVLNLEQVSLTATLNAKPMQYAGNCPVTVNFEGEITASGPCQVKYRFERSDNSITPVHTLVFESAGKRRVRDTWTLGKNIRGWERIVIMQPVSAASERANFSVKCQ